MNIIDADAITEPGFYRMACEQYHRDPLPEPSLSNSIAKVMLGRSPRHAWARHPRLNPDCPPQEPNRQMDFGTVAHCLLLGKGREIVLVEAADWKTKAAKEARAEAAASGKVAVLAHKFEQADAMASAVRRQVEKVSDCENAFIAGDPELVLAWREGSSWCRSMVDWIEPRRATGHIVVYDLKTTAMSAAPHAVSRLLYGQEYEMQAAFITAGIEALIPDAAGKVIVRFVVVENDPPHLCSVVELDAAGLAIGRKKMHAALGLWQRCLADDHWPGYPDRIVEAELPPWCEAGWLEREMGDPMIAPPEDDPDGEFVNYLAAG
jgi:hypothetical protein